VINSDFQSRREYLPSRGLLGYDTVDNTTRCHNPEDLDVKYHRCESLKTLIRNFLIS